MYLSLDSTVVRDTLAVNYYGTVTITQELIPLMRKGGRIVQIASIAGDLGKFSPTIKQSFITASETSVDSCTDLMKMFQASVDAKKEKEEGWRSGVDAKKEKEEKEQGWRSAAYSTSKAGLIAATKILAKENVENVHIVSCCPGFVSTDLTKGDGKKTPDEGAKTPVMLALGQLKGEVGEFWQNEKLRAWYS